MPRLRARPRLRRPDHARLHRRVGRVLGALRAGARPRVRGLRDARQPPRLGRRVRRAAPGVDGPQAMRSVAMHLMRLCLVYERGMAAGGRPGDGPAAAVAAAGRRVARAARRPRRGHRRRRRRGRGRPTSISCASTTGAAACGAPGPRTTRRCAAGSTRRSRACCRVCPDRPGIIAAVVALPVRAVGTNIAQLATSTRPILRAVAFFLRHGVPSRRPARRLRASCEARVRRGGRRAGSRWSWRMCRHRAARKRIAILVSREDHCLLDLLWRWRRGELRGRRSSSSSPTTRTCARTSRPSGCRTATCRSTTGAKPDAEARLLELLRRQLSTSSFSRATCRSSPVTSSTRVGAPVINIHHSFLPAFAGAGPVRAREERGVKLIGATAHYVTEELDAGPIIEQDVDPRHAPRRRRRR